jgi:hypothetical protein
MISGMAPAPEAPGPAQAEAKVVQPTPESKVVHGLKSEFLKAKVRENASAKDHDVALVTGQIVLAEGNKFIKDAKTLDQAKLAKISAEHPDQSPYILYAYLHRPDFTEVTLTSPLNISANPDGSFGVPQESATNIKPVQKIISREGVFFKCQTSDGGEISVPVDVILGAHLTAIGKAEAQIEGAMKKGVVTKQQVEIIQAYADMMTVSGSKKSESITTKALEDEALATGLVTVESLRTFAEKNGLVIAKPDPAKLASAADDVAKQKIIDENTARNAEIQKTLDLFEGHIVASPETVTQVITTLLPEGITKLNISLEMESVKLMTAREALQPNDPHLKEKGEQLDQRQAEINQQKAILSQAEQFLNGDGELSMMDLFGSVQRGEIPPARIASLDAALKANNPIDVINAFSNTANLNEAQKNEVKKYEGLYKAGKVSIWVALGSIGMMVWQALSKKEGVGG